MMTMDIFEGKKIYIQKILKSNKNFLKWRYKAAKNIINVIGHHKI